ncbi:hydrolase [Halostagnicola sp. A56]|uniref:MBL fold metallo-hydrolase n=1 Tax=Halostagnicola sp. A56 TaxID=1495067 RepID=UPI0004A05461|nr:MBL fold metallo-hydrolase [Halostagnicola sp. A56]KDE58561.1 hydrolase [Halostagnicola sp. A56]
MTVSYGAVAFDWLSRATVRLESQTGVVIYVDPDRAAVPGDPTPRDGDLVLVTHEHHYDPDGIERVARDDAVVVIHESINGRETDAREGDRSERDHAPPADLPYDVERVRADESFVLGPLDLFTTPAYNEPDGPHTRDDGSAHHPEGTGCGYAITVDGVRAFFAGHTDALEYHEDLDVDVFVPPIDGDTTMDRHEAAALVGRMAPRLVCPIYDEAASVDTEAFVVDVATRAVPVVLENRNTSTTGLDGEQTTE